MATIMPGVIGHTRPRTTPTYLQPSLALVGHQVIHQTGPPPFTHGPTVHPPQRSRDASHVFPWVPDVIVGFPGWTTIQTTRRHCGFRCWHSLAWATRLPQPIVAPSCFGHCHGGLNGFPTQSTDGSFQPEGPRNKKTINKLSIVVLTCPHGVLQPFDLRVFRLHAPPALHHQNTFYQDACGPLWHMNSPAGRRAATWIFSHVLPKWMMWIPSTVRRKT